MDGTRKYHPGQGNSDAKEHTWYVFTDKWILGKDHGIPMIQLMDHMKLKRKEDASVLFRRGNNIIKGSRERERLGRKKGGEEKKRARFRYGKRWRRSTEDQEIEQRCVAMGDGELG